MPKRIQNIINIIIFLILFTIGIVNLFCYLAFNTTINPLTIQAIIFTNFNETSSFIYTYFIGKTALFVCIFIFISMIILFMPIPKIKFHINFKQIKKILIISIVISIIISINNIAIIKYVIFPFNNIILVYNFLDKHYKELNKLKLHLNQEIKGLHTTLDIPIIVLIIGESMQRNYMSIYGYPLNTTPNLKVISDNNLHIFTDIVAPHAQTHEALSKILTFSNYENNELPWYKFVNIVDIMKASQYHTYWLSTQEPVSIHGSSFGEISIRSDNLLHIMPKKYEYNAKDEMLLDKIKQVKLNKKSFIVFHLMGAHTSYADRYTKDFEKFNSKILRDNSLDMLNSIQTLNDNQIKTKTQYLNAILYNDYIVSEIFKYFKNKNAIIFYISDHGDEVYDFRDFVGHSETMPSRFMIEVPFIIYTTDSFNKAFPQVIKKIKNSTKLPQQSDDFIHSMLGILGISTNDYDKKRDITNPSYNQKRQRIFSGDHNYDNDFKNKN